MTTKGSPTIGPGGLEVSIEVVKFYNDFKNGFFAGDAVADVTLNVKVLRPDHSVAFTKLYTGQGREENIQLALGENARLALIRALRDAVDNLVGDSELTQALIADKAAHVTTPAGVPPAAPPPAPVVTQVREPVMIGDGTCMYKGPPPALLSLHIENGGRYVSQPRGTVGTPETWECRNGRLERIAE